MTFSEIQKAIEELPPEEQTKLVAWIASRDRSTWDAELDRDFAAGGAGSELMNNVRRQIREGRSKPLAEGPR